MEPCVSPRHRPARLGHDLLTAQAQTKIGSPGQTMEGRGGGDPTGETHS